MLVLVNDYFEMYHQLEFSKFNKNRIQKHVYIIFYNVVQYPNDIKYPLLITFPGNVEQIPKHNTVLYNVPHIPTRLFGPPRNTFHMTWVLVAYRSKLSISAYLVTLVVDKNFSNQLQHYFKTAPLSCFSIVYKPAIPRQTSRMPTKRAPIWLKFGVGVPWPK